MDIYGMSRHAGDRGRERRPMVKVRLTVHIYVTFAIDCGTARSIAEREGKKISTP
jgi:hypothetical protein